MQFNKGQYRYYYFKETEDSFFKNYTYLIVNSKNSTALCIDPADNAEKVIEFCEGNHIETCSILLTHSHYDHIGETDLLVKRYNSKIYITKAEDHYYSVNMKNTVHFDQCDTYTISGIPVTVYNTPGHSMGSACYLIEENLFTGDTLFIEGCGLCSENGGDPLKMFKSIQYLKKEIPHSVKVFPGHSYGREPGVPFSFLRRCNIYLRFATEKEFTAFRTRKNQKGLFAFC